MFSLRPATDKDAPDIRSLVYQAHLNPTNLDWRRFIVAVDAQGVVIGCGQIKPHKDDIREMASLVVSPHWRGQGVGKAIIGYLLAHNPGELYLMCRSGLGEYYNKFGFRKVPEAQLPKYFWRIMRMYKFLTKLSAREESLLVMSWID